MIEQGQAKVMQINMINGVNVQIGVENEAEFKLRKDDILKDTKEFVKVIDTCTIRKSQISTIEYFVIHEPEPVAPIEKKKGGFFKWLRK